MYANHSLNNDTTKFIHEKNDKSNPNRSCDENLPECRDPRTGTSPDEAIPVEVPKSPTSKTIRFNSLKNVKFIKGYPTISGSFKCVTGLRFCV